ncbi:MAG: Subtilase family protein [Candidatus Kentron sp. G]|nr:MAG: Subtilase family protein [Candidatus Kentron sp. G]VFM95677.1 MAG: Subtilase family protein [Candidatus Kentron sp. G]VFM99000.1 MAG: Subtilase family protein [Candidatus Kentron sp. G]
MISSPTKFHPIKPLSTLAFFAILLFPLSQPLARDWGYIAEPPPEYGGDDVHFYKGLDDEALFRELGLVDFDPKTLPRAKAGFGSDRMAPELRRLAFHASTKGMVLIDDLFEELMLPRASLGREPAVEVEITASGHASGYELEAMLESNGARITLEEDGVLFATVPVSALETLADSDEVGYVMPETRFEISERYRQEGRHTSDGLPKINIDHLHRAGLKGKGVRVGILDLEFEGYRRLVNAGELPRAVATRGFGGPFEAGGGVHGTACAEIVHDVAPDAELVLARFHGGRYSNLILGARWLAEQKVDIISASFATNQRAINGRARSDRMVDGMVRNNDIAWVIAAGNEGARIWSTEVSDGNGNGLVDVTFQGRNYDYLAVQMLRNSPWGVRVLWDDWGLDPSRPAATQDIDVYLVIKDPRTGKAVIVGKSVERQNGRQQPAETIIMKRPLPGGAARLVLHMKRVTRPVKLRVIPLGAARVIPTSSRYSIASPGSAEEALTVGAVDVLTGRIANYSSRGSTTDGRLKPEVAALIKQLDPSATARELRKQTMAHVRKMGTPSPNNTYGHGHIDGGRIPARPARTGRDHHDPVPPGQGGEDPVPPDVRRAIDDLF